ncbi:hypothetical protein [Carnobacterium divergens]|uniref:hypothetical protein n=1 Tax=Carnobacterium divergens TaxID=2748 RepID=UPI0028904A08|nr:hypothetical protein [Carnobacterium divergens]MDT2010832.1 hypothetical protein [Carnobacterium divergens]
MISYLRLFHYQPTSGTIKLTDGKIFETKISSTESLQLDENISNFFQIHADNSIDDDTTQNFRFKDKLSDLVPVSLRCFKKWEDFDECSLYIAQKLKEKISKNVKNDFYLIIYTYKKENDNILCIVKMECTTGIQIRSESALETLNKMLPDKKSRLQKAAFIFKSATTKFKDGEEPVGQEREHVHSRILDRQDNTISGYFFNDFLESYKVVDTPESIANLAIKTISDLSGKYIKADSSKDVVKEMLKNELSIEKSTSFDALSNIVYSNLDEKKLNGKTYQDFSNEAFNIAKDTNPTVVKSFKGKVINPPKIKLIDVDKKKRINISFYKSLQDSEQVKLDTTSNERQYILTINKDLVNIIEDGKTSKKNNSK